ncbi:MAG: acyltransferase family protein [Oceanidesulfovibrio sp.]
MVASDPRETRMAKSPNQPYLPQLDHLRAAAALLIFFYHGFQLFSAPLEYGRSWSMGLWLHTDNPLLALLVEGHTAVAIFFVMSGFILTRGALPHLGQGKRLLHGPFILNRILRTYPLYIFLLLLGAYTHLDLFTLRGLVQTVLPLYNLPGALELDWFTAIFWAVAVLFQFYLLFPFVVRFLHKQGTRPLWLMMAAFMAGRFACLAMGAGARDLAYLTLVGRMDQFLLGMLAAVVYASLDERRMRRLAWSLIPALGATIAAVYVFHRLGGWPAEAWWKLLWVTAEGALWAWVMLAYIAAGDSWKKGRLSRGLSWLGRLSFSIFLIHLVVMAIINKLSWHLHPTGNGYIDAFATTALAALPITLAAAMLAHHGIERPFLGLRMRYFSEIENES